jgi:hypothetical protein
MRGQAIEGGDAVSTNERRIDMRNSIKALLVTISLAGLSCGSNAKDLSHFIGVWSVASGTFTITCAGTPSTSQVTGTETWATSSTSDLVETIPGTTCVFHADVSANTATGLSSQLCTINGTDPAYGTSYTEILTFVAYNFVVSPDGKTATENFSGNATYTESGSTQNCSFTQTASYTKQ